MRAHKIFVVRFIGLVAVTLALVFAINAYIDPLWYFHGNRLTGQNYAFDDRSSKLNLYLRNPKAYDCILFGASSVSMLDTREIKGHSCFNFSFRRGTVLEYVNYAKYIKSIGSDPALILVAVDLYNLQVADLSDQTPDNVRELKPPPSSIEQYLAWEPLIHSLKAMLGWLHPGAIVYDEKFKGILLPPENAIPKTWRQNLSGEMAQYYSSSIPATDRNLTAFKELRDVFGTARYVGFTLPRTVGMTLEMKEAGILDPSLAVIHELSQIFDQFYDFTLPSQPHVDLTDTFDGFHYGQQTAQRMLDEINGTTNIFLHPHDLTLEAYRDAYRRNLNDRADAANTVPLK